MQVYETRLTFTDARQFDDYLELLARLRPGHSGTALSLNLLPHDFTGRQRILSFATFHDRHGRAEWVVELIRPPSPVPPRDIVDLSARLGGINGFVARLSKLLGAAPLPCTAQVVFELERQQFTSRWLPAVASSPPGAHSALRTVSWLFEQPAALTSLALSDGGSATWTADVGLSTLAQPGPNMFTDAEEVAWTALGRFISTPKKPGPRRRSTRAAAKSK